MKWTLATLRKNEHKLRSRIVMCGVDECWPWLGAKDRDGYGRCPLGKSKEEKAHRMVFALDVRMLVDDEQVLHSCDNPPCCNPRHLFVGTHQDNVTDCMSKGRRHDQRGEGNGAALLTDNEVREIRKLRRDLSLQQKDVAARYDISRSLVGLIWQRKRWVHVT